MNEMKPLVDKKTQGDGSSNADANAEVHDSTGKVLAIVAFGISFIALGMQVAGGFQDRHDLLAAQREVARLNTLVLNHTDKLDDDTIVAQGLLTAANSALAGCKK